MRVKINRVCKFYKVYQNLVTTSFFLGLFYLIFFYHVKTYLWMSMIELRIIIVQNIVFLKKLTTFDSLFFFMGIKIFLKKKLQ